MKLQQYLLDELENSKDNPGRTLHGEKYVEDLFLTMKAFWDQFTGEITHETTCTSTSCKRTFEDQESFTFLLLKFPELDHNEDCTVDSLIKHYLPKEQCLEPRDCICSDKRIPGNVFQEYEILPLLTFPLSFAFYSVAKSTIRKTPFLQQLSFLPLIST